MDDLSLEAARKIVATALGEARRLSLKPVAVAVLDARGSLKAFECEDGNALIRPKVAHGKAFGAIAMGIGSRAIFERAQQQPFFIDAMNTLAGGDLVPVPGGVLIRDGDKIIGAVGISGDTSDNDEACAVVAISAAGFLPDTGG